MRKHLDITVTGRVQGVFFRDSTRQFCEQRGITGFAKNDSDGSVKIEAEGDKDKLQELLDWCKEGPTHAQVDNVQADWGELQDFEDFKVIWRYG